MSFLCEVSGCYYRITMKWESSLRDSLNHTYLREIKFCVDLFLRMQILLILRKFIFTDGQILITSRGLTFAAARSVMLMSIMIIEGGKTIFAK